MADLEIRLKGPGEAPGAARGRALDTDGGSSALEDRFRWPDGENINAMSLIEAVCPGGFGAVPVYEAYPEEVTDRAEKHDHQMIGNGVMLQSVRHGMKWLSLQDRQFDRIDAVMLSRLTEEGKLTVEDVVREVWRAFAPSDSPYDDMTAAQNDSMAREGLRRLVEWERCGVLECIDTGDRMEWYPVPNQRVSIASMCGVPTDESDKLSVMLEVEELKADGDDAATASVEIVEWALAKYGIIDTESSAMTWRALRARRKKQGRSRSLPDLGALMPGVWTLAEQLTKRGALEYDAARGGFRPRINSPDLTTGLRYTEKVSSEQDGSGSGIVKIKDISGTDKKFRSKRVCLIEACASGNGKLMLVNGDHFKLEDQRVRAEYPMFFTRPTSSWIMEIKNPFRRSEENIETGRATRKKGFKRGEIKGPDEDFLRALGKFRIGTDVEYGMWCDLHYEIRKIQHAITDESPSVRILDHNGYTEMRENGVALLLEQGLISIEKQAWDYSGLHMVEKEVYMLTEEGAKAIGMNVTGESREKWVRLKFRKKHGEAHHDLLVHRAYLAVYSHMMHRGTHPKAVMVDEELRSMHMKSKDGGAAMSVITGIPDMVVSSSDGAEVKVEVDRGGGGGGGQYGYRRQEIANKIAQMHGLLWACPGGVISATGRKIAAVMQSMSIASVGRVISI